MDASLTGSVAWHGLHHTSQLQCHAIYTAEQACCTKQKTTTPQGMQASTALNNTIKLYNTKATTHNAIPADTSMLTYAHCIRRLNKGCSSAAAGVN
jgi:endonuclease YncB( thermonuclease family)